MKNKKKIKNWNHWNCILPFFSKASNIYSCNGHFFIRRILFGFLFSIFAHDFSVWWIWTRTTRTLTLVTSHKMAFVTKMCPSCEWVCNSAFIFRTKMELFSVLYGLGIGRQCTYRYLAEWNLEFSWKIGTPNTNILYRTVSLLVFSRVESAQFIFISSAQILPFAGKSRIRQPERTSNHWQELFIQNFWTFFIFISSIFRLDGTQRPRVCSVHLYRGDGV